MDNNSNLNYISLNNMKKILFYLFKKKLLKKNKVLNRKNILKYFKIFFLFNIYSDKFYFDSFLINFNLIKNLWIVFSNLYILKYINLKRQFVNFYLLFFTKWKFLNILKLEFKKDKNKKSFLFLKFLNINNVLKLCNFKLLHLNKILHKKLKTNFYVHKTFKYYIDKKISIKNPLFVFNKYKKSIFFRLVRYYIRFFRLKIKKEFIFFWNRFYKYRLKRLYRYMNLNLKLLIYYIYRKYSLLESLLSLRKKKNYFFFFYMFFNDSDNKYKFIKNYKIFLIYNNANKLLNSVFYKKNVFNLFIFNIKKSRFNCISKLKEKFNLLKNIIIIKFILYFRNFFILFIFKFIIIWFNFFLLCSSFFVNKRVLDKNFVDINLMFNRMYKMYNFNKIDNIVDNNIFKWNYFFYKNIII